MSKSNKIFIQAALCGAGTTKKMNPDVPITPDEIAADTVACVKAGAAIVHVHVRDSEGKDCSDTAIYKETSDKIRDALAKEGLDCVLNLTTSGSRFPDEDRVRHLGVCMPEMCSYDPGSLNWGYKGVFLNRPSFLEMCGAESIRLNIKPECEVFDGGMMGAIDYYVKNGFVKDPVHYQFVLGVAGGMPGDVSSLSYLLPRMRPDSTWSITGIGKSHLPCLLMGLALGADGLRVGLEDNLYYSRGELTTNPKLVERACNLAIMSGRQVATAQETREILGLTKHVNF